MNLKTILIIGGVSLLVASVTGEFKWYQLVASAIIFIGGIVLKESER